jgi:hypothetical protein
MKVLLTFVKEKGLWYADIPAYIKAGGSKNDCLMVAGADKLLDSLASGKCRLTVSLCGSESVSLKNTRTSVVLRMKLDGRRNGWAFYDVLFTAIPLTIDSVGLCPINAFVWGGGHPTYIVVEHA